jgi:ribosome-associated protein
MLRINSHIVLNESDLEFSAIRSQGSGGQNVNKVSTAIQLRFDIHKADLPEHIRKRLLQKLSSKISSDGILCIKAQNHRSQTQNKDEAIQRLCTMIRKSLHTPPRRIPTQATKSSKRRRVEKKKERGQIKNLRGRVDLD